MASAYWSRQHVVYYLIAFGLLAGVLCWVVAAPPLAPRREEMILNDVPVVVEYATSASAEDLMLPFYPGARVEESFAYTVTTREGKPVSYYAAAALTSSDAPERIVAGYQARLPGRPEAEVVEDSSGKRHVLAVADDNEVREVTVTGDESGSRIQLIRATRPAVPAKPLRPRGPQEKVI